MPTAGKSTVGVLLAKELNKDFLDTDVYIQRKEDQDLQKLVDQKGLEEFCKLEGSHICQLNCTETVIATGGSVPYSDQAMQKLKKDGIIIYLYLTIEKVKQRLTNFSTRGIVIEKNCSLQQLYQQRSPIYEKYADLKIDTSNMNQEQTIDAIIYELAGK